jgi:hypothetical protein
MEPWLWAVALKPFMLLALFGAFVIPLELLLNRFMPESSLKTVLFDRTFPTKYPGKYMVIWFGLMIGLWSGIALLLHRGG